MATSGHLTLNTVPTGATHWRCRTVAAQVGVSSASVQRAWRAHRVHPHRVSTFKVSKDFQVLEKLTDVVGLYMKPPDNAAVLCLDEKTMIRALDRTPPGLPLKRGKAGTMTRDDKRHHHGTIDLFAALKILDGEVLGECRAWHRHQEFLCFLRKLDRQLPTAVDPHLVLDHASTHSEDRVRAWLDAHARFRGSGDGCIAGPPPGDRSGRGADRSVPSVSAGRPGASGWIRRGTGARPGRPLGWHVCRARRSESQGARSQQPSGLRITGVGPTLLGSALVNRTLDCASGGSPHLRRNATQERREDRHPADGWTRWKGRSWDRLREPRAVGGRLGGTCPPSSDGSVAPPGGLRVDNARMPDNWIEAVGQGPAAEPGKRLRILVLEDEPLFRDLLVRALDRPGLRVVGAFATAPEALEAAPHVRPDVAILDIELAGGWTGIRVGVQMRQLVPRVGVLLLSNHADAELLSGVRPEELAGWSYLLKRSVADVSALVRAIEGAAAGLVVLDPQLLKRRSSRLSGPLGTLTPRQLQVLDLIAQGYTNSGIAEQLGLAEKSVENQINLLYHALAIDRADGSLHVRVQAVLTYLGHRLES